MIIIYEMHDVSIHYAPSKVCHALIDWAMSRIVALHPSYNILMYVGGQKGQITLDFALFINLKLGAGRK